MRTLVQGEIIEKTKLNKTNYKYELYSMIMNNLHHEVANQFHKKNKEFRLLSFSNVYITGNNIHFYLVAKEDISNSLIEHLSFNRIIRLGDMVINITKILPQNQLEEKTKYLFKTSLIINVNKDGMCLLSDEFDYIEARLKEISINKAKQCGINKDNINFEILNPVKEINRYKNGHINSWKCYLKISGDYELINFLYTTSGVGENTATGHGFLWEV